MDYFIYSFCDFSREYVGLIKTLPFSFFLENKIHMHEKVYIRAYKKIYQDFERTRIQKTPIILFHQQTNLNALIKKSLESEKILYSRETKNEYRETIRSIEDRPFIESLNKELASIDSYCVADGHHRLSAFADYYEKNSDLPLEMKTINTGIFFYSELKMIGPSIIIKIPDKSFAQLLKQAKLLCKITELEEITSPNSPHEFVMNYKGKWYHLVIKEKVKNYNLNKDIFINSFIKKLSLNSVSIIRENLVVSSLKRFNLEEFEIFDPSVVTFILSPDKPLRVFELAKKGYRAEQHSTCFIPKMPRNLIKLSLPSLENFISQK